MTTDYAGELLGTEKPKEPSRNYAADLLGPKPTFSGHLEKRKAEVDRAGSFGALTLSAMVDNPQTKIRILAKDLFPGEKGAEERFGVVNGELMYVGKDDKLYKATPGGFKEFGADMLGNALPIAGATIGGVLTAPAGGVTAVGGAGLGAAIGKSAQEVVANLALDEPQTVGGNLAGIAKEGAWAAGGAMVGQVLQKWLQRNVSRDISKFDPAKVADLDRKAADVGVDLNVAQRTDLPSLKGRTEALARLPQTADDMNTALERTRQQAGQAAENYVAGVSPSTPSVRAAGETGRKGATTILDRIAEDRATAAKPWYEKALSQQLDPRNGSLGNLPDTPAFKSAFERGKRIAANEGVDGATFDNVYDMRTLHYVKLGLDDLIEKGGTKEGIGTTEKRAIIGVKNKLLDFMDKSSPDYARARSIYGHFMPTLKANREGLVGQLADMADTDLQTATRQVFNSNNSPDEIRRLRSMFFRYDQGEQWKAITKGYLQDTLEQASREFKSGGGAGKAVTWRYALMGDPKQRNNLRAAMTDDQWQAFGEMMDVFEAVGRTTGRGNSITMPMTEAANELRKDAGSGVARKILAPRETIIDWLEEARLGKHASKQVEILNDPNGIKRLKELRKMSPNDQRFIQGFSTLFGISASPE
jgi:hypothetical protein